MPHIVMLSLGLLFGVGLLLGIGVSMRGWRRKGFLGSLSVLGGGQLVGAVHAYFTQGEKSFLRELFALSRELPFSHLALGGLTGIALFQIVGALLIWNSARHDDESGEGWRSSGGRCVRTFWLEGLEAYHAIREQDRKEAEKARAEQQVSEAIRALTFQELMLADLSSRVLSPPTSMEEAWRACQQTAGMLLRIVFENRGGHDEYRLAIFETEGDELVLRASVGPADAPHDPKRLSVDDSFLGDVIKTGTPDVWVRGRQNGRPYQRRGRSRQYKCFYAEPLPCDGETTKWGGFTIDHKHKCPGVFTPVRKYAIRAFARYVAAVYALIAEEVGDEAESESAGSR